MSATLNEIGQMTWRHRSVIDLDNWTREEFLFFLDQSRHMENVMDRPVKKVPALRGKMCVNLFFENSTRTRVSFELAEKMLSADVVNWSVSGSSTAKGETMRDTAWTLESMGADIVVMRHGAVGAAQYLASKLKHGIVLNAGDGTHAHPDAGPSRRLHRVEALRRPRGPQDCARRRRPAQPRRAQRRHSLQDDGLRSSPLRTADARWREVECLGVTYERDARKAVEGADMVYLLRIQRERQQDGLFPSVDEYHRWWGADEELMKLAKPGALAMHPGPINRGVEIASEVADGHQSVILEQVRSGVATRMALLYLCGGGAR